MYVERVNDRVGALYEHVFSKAQIEGQVWQADISSAVPTRGDVLITRSAFQRVDRLCEELHPEGAERKLMITLDHTVSLDSANTSPFQFYLHTYYVKVINSPLPA
jgi:hypothetical protein